MNPADLSEWQRLAPLALVVAVIVGWVNFVRRNLFAFAGAGAGLSYLGSIGTRGLLLAMAGLVLASLLGSIVYYRRFRFRIDRDALRVRRGLFEIKDLRVRFARVQNVGFSQPFYFRPFGLVRFLVQTPGSQGAEVDLPGISMEVAQQLRQRISQASGRLEAAQELASGAASKPAAGQAGPEHRQLLFKASPGRLFMHGLSSNQVWILAGVFVYLVSNLGYQAEQFLQERGGDLAMPEMPLVWAVALLSALAVALLALLFSLSGLLSIVRFYGFVLKDSDRRFIAAGGLFDRREQTIQHSKLTGLAITQSFLGRLGGMYAMTVQQTNAGTQQNEHEARRIVVPGMRRADLVVTEQLMPGLKESDVLWPVNRRLRTWLWTRPGAAVLIVALTGFFILKLPLWVLCVVALVYLLLAHRIWCRRGWRVADDFCQIQRGVFGRRRDIFRLDMVQQVVIAQSPYQRRHGLATLRMLLPHGWISLPFIDLAEADDLINRTVWLVETARQHRV